MMKSVQISPSSNYLNEEEEELEQYLSESDVVSMVEEMLGSLLAVPI